MQKGRDAVWIKQKKNNEKDREEQEDFWLTLEPLPAPDKSPLPAPHEE